MTYLRGDEISVESEKQSEWGWEIRVPLNVGFAPITNKLAV